MSQHLDIFSQLFGDSLVTPIKGHMHVCYQTAQNLPRFFDAVIEEDLNEVARVFNQICQLEHDADDRKRYIRLNLPSGMLFSVSRNDLLEWVRAQDKIANVTRDVAGVIKGRAIRIPSFLHEDLRACVGQSVKSVAALEHSLEDLDTLVGTGFIPGRANRIMQGVDNVDQAERCSDELEHQAYRRLFAHEKDMDPVEVMFLYQVIDLIGEVSDRAQSVANRIRIAVAA